MAAPKTWQGRMVPKRLRSTAARIASSERSKTVPPGGTMAPGMLPPAALTRMSSLSQRASRASRAVSSSARCSTSAGSGIASPPSAVMAAATSSALCARRPSTATFAPARASPWAMAPPSAPVAPVTRATCPSSEKRESMYPSMRLKVPEASRSDSQDDRVCQRDHGHEGGRSCKYQHPHLDPVGKWGNRLIGPKVVEADEENAKGNKHGRDPRPRGDPQRTADGVSLLGLKPGAGQCEGSDGDENKGQQSDPHDQSLQGHQPTPLSVHAHPGNHGGTLRKFEHPAAP